MKILLKILKKIIWFIIFVVVAVLAFYFVYKGVLKMEFSDSIKYHNIKYSAVDKNMCLIFDQDGYELNDCMGSSSGLSFDSGNKCSMNYSKGYNAIIFDCGIKNISLVKFKELSFNKVIFSNKDKEYTLINTSTFSTMDGLQKISFSFVDGENIKFSKYIDNNLVDEETCHYKYDLESMGLECQRFYGYASFRIENYENNKVTIIIRGVKTVFTLDN